MIRWGVGVLLVALLLAGCGESAGPGDEGAAAPLPTPGAVPERGTTSFDAHAPAQDPAELARRVTAAEDAVRESAASEGEIAAAAFELQMLYRQLARRPRWEPAALEALPQRHHRAVRHHIAARREFRSMHRTLSDMLPAWEIVSPAPAEDLRTFYEEAEATYGVPWEILAAINLVETGMGRIRGVSVAGAQGPMQFMPGTWDAFGEGDVNDPRDAIMAAARYLAHNGGGEGRVDNALFRYNNHNAYVRGVKHYAAIIEDDPAAFATLYHWQVLYLSEIGDVWLPVGYHQPERVPVRRYVRANPDQHLGSDTR